MAMVKNIVELAWSSFDRAYRAWQNSLPDDHEALISEDGCRKLDLFFEAHPNGWPIADNTDQ